MDCVTEPVITYIIGITVCILGPATYIPQFINFFKAKNIRGISEFSYWALNIGSCTLAINTFILNFPKFKCFDDCSFWICNGNLLSVYAIILGYLGVFLLYAVYLWYKFKGKNTLEYDGDLLIEEENSIEENEDFDLELEVVEHRIFSSLGWKIIMNVGFLSSYLIFLAIVLILCLVEEYNVEFMERLAYVMGTISSIFSLFTWIPQIYVLIREKNVGNLSIKMFIIQAPCNGFLIFFQAYLFRQSVTTWIPYLVTVIQQLIIIIIAGVYWCKKRKATTSEEQQYLINNN